MKKYIIAIPFYKNEDFLDNFVDWYGSDESSSDKNYVHEVLIINDCPDSGDSKKLQSKTSRAGFSYIENPKNIGYLNTVNSAYQYAKAAGLNLMLLNSDTIPFPGFITEINSCFESDAMLGVVSARSNNATICNLYNHVSYYNNDNSIKVYKKDIINFSKYMPQITYVPVATGFCFAIRNEIISIFDGFDQIYTVGYEEENDYCIRISERGFRVGVANRAFVAHLEGQSFGLTGYRKEIQDVNARIIRQRYRYYDSLIANYSQSISCAAQKKVSASCANKVKYFFDLRVLSPCHNGSNKVIIEFIRAFSLLGDAFDVLTHANAADFHDIASISNLRLLTGVSQTYEYGFMIGQPMNIDQLWLCPSVSLISTCIFFDTIAHDCPQLRTENLDLDSIWTVLPYIYTDISFISEHSMNQFRLKFGKNNANLHSHLLPTKFHPVSERTEFESNKVGLVFGNKFHHKGVDMLISELPEEQGTKYYVLGNALITDREDIIYLPPGQISDAKLDSIMKSADFILMPSFAEGFGFPLVEALSYGKPIYCRDIPCYREISRVVDKKYLPLIRFVTDFSKYKTNYTVPDGLNNFGVPNDCKQYVSKVLYDIQRDNPSEKVYSSLKLRYLLMNSNTYAKQIYVPRSSGVLVLLKKIYGFSLRTPLAPIARRVKACLY